MYQKSVKAGSQSGIGKWSEEEKDEEIMSGDNNEDQTTEQTQENGSSSTNTAQDSNLCRHHAKVIMKIIFLTFYKVLILCRSW